MWAARSPLGTLLVPWCLSWVSLYYVLTAPDARRASGELADRTGRGGSRLRRLWFALRHFYGFGRLLLDRLLILGGAAADYTVTSHGREQLREVLAQGRGAVFVTSHLGNWEAMGHLVGDTYGTPLTLVMSPEAPTAAMAEVSRERQVEVIVADGTPITAAKILKALRAGRVVGLMGDRVYAGRTVRLAFLGAPVDFPLGPFALAAAAGVPVLHVFAVRTGSRTYEFHTFFAGTPERVRGSDDAYRDWAQGYVTRLEEFVRSYPEQWGNLYSVWKAAATNLPTSSA